MTERCVEENSVPSFIHFDYTKWASVRRTPPGESQRWEERNGASRRISASVCAAGSSSKTLCSAPLKSSHRLTQMSAVFARAHVAQ
jgi:hypothetical protein